MHAASLRDGGSIGKRRQQIAFNGRFYIIQFASHIAAYVCDTERGQSRANGDQRAGGKRRSTAVSRHHVFGIVDLLFRQKYSTVWHR